MPRKEGSCTIIGEYGGVKYKCKVTVLKTIFSVTKKSYSLKYGAQTKVNIKSNPELTDRIDPESFKTSNKKVATFDMATNEIIAKGTGSCEITLAFYNGQKIICKVTVGAQTFEQQLIASAAYAMDLGFDYNYITGTTYAKIYLFNGKSKDISYIDFDIYQYNNKGERLSKNNSSFVYNDTVIANDFSSTNC